MVVGDCQTMNIKKQETGRYGHIWEDDRMETEVMQPESGQDSAWPVGRTA